MAEIGRFGKEIIFKVSSKKVLTFNGYTENIAGRWARHNIQGKLPRSEFLGADLMAINVKVILDASLGVDPEKVRNVIKEYIRNGRTRYFVIGGKLVSNNKFKITQAQNEFEEIIKKESPNVLMNAKIKKAKDIVKIKRIVMTLNFEEYV